MRMRLLVALAAGLMVGSGEPPPSAVVQSEAIPAGIKWSRTDSGGQTWVDEFGRDGIWRSVSRNDGSVILMPEKYTLNLTASPPRIDTTCKGRHRHGIYRLEGDRLTICLSDWNSPSRPTSFAHRPEAGQCLYVLKRLPGKAPARARVPWVGPPPL
jgi:uncharacterized protein (TIGR03067 family)